MRPGSVHSNGRLGVSMYTYTGSLVKQRCKCTHVIVEVDVSVYLKSGEKASVAAVKKVYTGPSWPIRDWGCRMLLFVTESPGKSFLTSVQKCYLQ